MPPGKIQTMLRGSAAAITTALLLSAIPVALISSPGATASLLRQKGLVDLLSVLPYVFFGVTAFLGVRMNQARILFSSLLLALAFFLVAQARSWAALPPSFRNECLAVALPLSLGLLFRFAPPGRILGRSGVVQALEALFPLGLLLLLVAYRTSVGHLIVGRQWVIESPSWCLSDLSLLLALGFAGSTLIQKERYLREFRWALVFSIVPLFAALNTTCGPVSPVFRKLAGGVTFTCVGFGLLYGIYRYYWQRVYIDELTELPNRRALEEKVQTLGATYAIAMVDIDFFKKFNDSFGHEEGDNVLRFVAKHLERESGGRAYRYGGEEFCLVFDGSAAKQVLNLVDGIRGKLAKREFYIRSPKHIRDATTKKDRGRRLKSEKVHITISIGIANPTHRHLTVEEVRHAADMALYKAKEEGRNRVVLS